MYQTTKGRFRFPYSGGQRYIPDAMCMGSQLHWQEETAQVTAGQSLTAELDTGNLVFAATQDWTISYPYRVKELTVAVEVDMCATWDSPGDYNALRTYADTLARVETVSTRGDGSTVRFGWGSGYRITSVDSTPIAGSGLWRITISLEANERKRWLAYAVYRKEMAKAGQTALAMAGGIVWDAIDTLGLVG